jgi:hypothetical protein
MKNRLTLFCLLLIICSCSSDKKFSGDNFSNNQNYLRWNKLLTDVIVEDLFNPPIATRIYSYCNIAAYEALVPAFPEYKSLAGQLQGLKTLPAPAAKENISYELAALTAFTTVAGKLVYSAYIINDFYKLQMDSLSTAGWEESTIKNSVDFGKAIADSIFSWSQGDGFRQSRGKERYVLKNFDGSWKPTAPDYMPAVEPYWGTLQTFTIDSSAMLAAEEIPKYSADKNSPYFKYVTEVYETGKNLTEEQKIIAVFWDDNPNVSTHLGHMTYFAQKMTPGGHWLAITAHAARMKKLSLMETAEVFTLTSIAMSDAFKCCWKEKYKYNSVRPITIINEAIDHDWNPLIQTPPFPEYPSGHSTVSAAAATVLTQLVGDNFSFTDSSEVEYGLPVRSFKSFNEAAAEAKMSRMYGGIHFSFANEGGAVLGKKIGEHVLAAVKTKAI